MKKGVNPTYVDSSLLFSFLMLSDRSQPHLRGYKDKSHLVIPEADEITPLTWIQEIVQLFVRMNEGVNPTHVDTG